MCPYQGLAAFDRRSSRFFHGRDRLVADVLRQIADRISDPRPLIVVGASGAGKTSLLRAGVLPALAAGDETVPGCWQWPQLVLRPGGDPLGALAALVAGPAGEPAGRVRAALAADPATLRRHLHTALAATGPHRRGAGGGGADAGGATRRVLLVVDQFEELFTAEVADSDRQAFVHALVAAARSGDTDPDGGGPAAGPAVVVVGVRADYYGRCTDYPQLAPALSGGQVVVGPMSRDELRQAITQPAAQAGLDLEHGLAEVLLRDLRVPAGTGDPGSDGGTPHGRPAGTLPLLSYALLP